MFTSLPSLCLIRLGKLVDLILHVFIHACTCTHIHECTCTHVQCSCLFGLDVCVYPTVVSNEVWSGGECTFFKVPLHTCTYCQSKNSLGQSACIALGFGWCIFLF